ncbi:hypothetical protein [Mucilaginibacter aquariorum]|uniref:MAPEG family protein n=1 Tax=Mucilaginibacter aquariorum TaxID=2967225 RepID=A0ABT1T3D8_9SPHI|nr:hypothetical protein [Mucilaginibacter aquariorum]MCQ6959124.1 hypothetical protein [Mucilaginibacter aquariorum]
MSAKKFCYLLFFAVFMLAAKPFLGFLAVKKIKDGKPIGICIKAFTKRKIEYVQDSAFDVSAVQKRLANPLLPLTILFTFFINAFFPSIFGKLRQITIGFLSTIHLSLFPPLHRYLLSGILII